MSTDTTNGTHDKTQATSIPASQSNPAIPPEMRVLEESEDKKKRRLLAKMGIGLGGMILGAIVGMAVQSAVEATGLLGPGLDQLISDQVAGFTDINAKLEELSSTSDPERVAALTAEVQSMIARQEELTQRSHDELRGARGEIARLKDAALEASGATVGANLWLKTGEGATIARPGNVLTVVRLYPNRANVNVSGEQVNLTVGEFVEFPDGDSTVRVYFKQSAERADGRVGFDVVRAVPAAS